MSYKLPALYELAIAEHGFPAAALNISRVTKLVKIAGDYLNACQARLGKSKETTPQLNHHGHWGIPAETTVYKGLQKPLTDMALESGLTEVGFMGAQEQASKPARAHYVVAPIIDAENFLAGGDDWGCALGLMLDCQPKGGVIYYPRRHEMLCTNDHKQAVRGNQVLQYVVYDRADEGIKLPTIDYPNETLVAKFARSGKNRHPDMYGNVALQAIVSRIVRPNDLWQPELP